MSATPRCIARLLNATIASFNVRLPHDISDSHIGRAALDDPPIFFVKGLLSAPVTEQGATTRRLYLPEGQWYDWWTAESIDGGRWIERDVDRATMPIYARAGAIVPLDPVRQYTDQPVDAPTEVRVFPGADGLVQWYDDDGVSMKYQRTGGTVLRVAWDDWRQQLQVKLAPDSAPLAHPKKLRVHVVGDTRTSDVTFVGDDLLIK